VPDLRALPVLRSSLCPHCNVALPHLPSGFQQERAGILAVAAELTRLGLIWRETPMADVGIDGQIEFTDDDGQVTGRLVAAQVKSGESYFNRGYDNGWHFYPHQKHRFYWERFPLPVVLFLHSPAEGTYWVDVRHALRTPERARLPYIAVPAENSLERATREQFLASVGASARPFLPVSDVLAALAATRSPSTALPVSYLDLFANGLTNITRSVYYGMDLVMEVAETLLNESADDVGLGLGGAEHDFLFGYVQFLVEQQIADVEISDCMIDWLEHHMHPTFIAPLTSRGRSLVRLIGEWQDRLTREGKLAMPAGVRLAQETFIRMQFTGMGYRRMSVIREFGQLVSESEPSRDAEPAH
jgi:hypothetical protein